MDFLFDVWIGTREGKPVLSSNARGVIGTIAAYIVGDILFASGFHISYWTFGPRNTDSPAMVVVMTYGAVPGIAIAAVYLAVYVVLRLYLNHQELWDKKQNAWIFPLVLSCTLASMVGFLLFLKAPMIPVTTTASATPQYTYERATLICQDCAVAGTPILLWAMPENPEDDEVTGELLHETRVIVRLSETFTDDGMRYYHVIGWGAGERQIGWVSEEYVQETDTP